MSTLKVNYIQANTTSEIDINSPLGTIPSLDVSGSANIGGNLNITGVSTFTGNSYVVGSLGIGTASPGAKFAISGTTADQFAAILSNPNNRVRGDYQRGFGTSHPVAIIGNNDDSTDGENGHLVLCSGDLTPTSGQYCGTLEFMCPESGKSNANASLKALIVGGLEGSGGSTGGLGGNIQFWTKGDNASGVGAERMRIDSNGRITTPFQPSCSIYLSTNQNITSGTWTQLNINTSRFNTGNNFNTSTYTFTAPVAGKYFISYTVNFALDTSLVSGGSYLYTAIKVNGAFYHYGQGFRNSVIWKNDTTLSAGQLVNLAANDTVNLWAYSDGNNVVSSGSERSHLAVHLLG